MPNLVILAAAGSGKTTHIVTEALADRGSQIAIVTFTQKNAEEIRRKFYELGGCIPPHVEVWTWLSFLLHELVRPYQDALYEPRIGTMLWVEKRSTRGIKKEDAARYYFDRNSQIYSDKVAEFAFECGQLCGGRAIARLKERFDHIYIDEVQDLAGYDLDLLDTFLRSGLRLTLVGDHRQATYSTNKSARNKQFAGAQIVRKFSEWEKAGLCVVIHHNHSYRCHQLICDLADSFYPGLPRTASRVEGDFDHCGVFTVRMAEAGQYVLRYAPQVLRYNVKTNCDGMDAMNFGESKGLGFKRVLIFPHGKAVRWLKTADVKHITKSIAKLYVAVTRAHYSVTFVFDGIAKIPGVNAYSATAAAPRMAQGEFDFF